MKKGLPRKRTLLIYAAKAAGMTVVGVLTSHTRAELKHADYTVNTVDDVRII